MMTSCGKYFTPKETINKIIQDLYIKRNNKKNIDETHVKPNHEVYNYDYYSGSGGFLNEIGDLEFYESKKILIDDI